ncbi:hypothetical protein PVL29_022118 [Vitis rotundifolia]|uniref:non-specific serine/threonine protein kinase n=1 Tax=Vitis rotundifolia TaxID=103349 RepID=A0AA38YV24_VITRO|nr:hypothetical protein PVL29_022118 [Vitis rotundifolia]
MHPNFSQSSLLISLILFLLSHHFPCSLCLDDFHYSNCTSPLEFECGHELGNIEYPFWVYGHQAEYCGHPLFKLYCEGGEHAIIEIKSRKYKVLYINPESQILQIVTMDVLPKEHIVCPQSPLMDSTPFNYTPYVEMAAVTLTNCSIDDHPGAYHFSCTMNNRLHEAYLATNLSVAKELRSRCKYGVIISKFPVLLPELEGLLNGSSYDVEEVLREGFEVQWTADNAICKECVRSGGTCGYDTTSNKSCCLCRDKPYPNKCSSMYPSAFLFSSFLCWFF